MFESESAENRVIYYVCCVCTWHVGRDVFKLRPASILAFAKKEMSTCDEAIANYHLLVFI